MIVIIGALLVVLGIVCIVNMIKKVRNTKQALIDQEMNKEPTYNTSNEVVNHVVNVVDLADLKKESHKKRRNRQKASNTLEETKEIKVLPASDDSSSENKEQK